MEKTLLIFKPSAVQRGLVGDVLSRFERKGLRIAALKMAQLTPEVLRQHYAHLVQKPFYPLIEESMMAAPVVLCCLEGVDAVQVVHEMAGATNGRKAQPGTVRGDYCMSNQENIIHTSDSPETAEAELARFFVPSDYFDYELPVQKYLYAPDEL
ncbi:MAG: nucleoside-diphosphate kinase [Bacteroidales bacterium]|nr:nucleoside-diphosphate kinase [Bacteroidales bacterium]